MAKVLYHGLCPKGTEQCMFCGKTTKIDPNRPGMCSVCAFEEDERRRVRILQKHRKKVKMAKKKKLTKEQIKKHEEELKKRLEAIFADENFKVKVSIVEDD